jgi:hypothetical protein
MRYLQIKEVNCLRFCVVRKANKANKAIKSFAGTSLETQLFMQFVFSCAKLPQIPQIITRCVWRSYLPACIQVDVLAGLDMDDKERN